VVGTTREDHWLDFRREPHTRAEDCARDVAQFANASGGVLVIGADEAGHVLSGWQAVPGPDEYIRWVDEIVKGHLTPVPVVEPVIIQIPGAEMVLILNVPPSPALIARRQNDGFEFPIRAADSRRYMTLLEVEARMNARERLTRLRIEQFGHNDQIALDAMMYNIDHYGWNLVCVDDDTLRLKKGALEAVIPLTYVDAVYPANSPHARWVLDLSCYITRVTQGGEFIHVSKNKPLHVQGEKYRTRRFSPG
jgi:hypothetical protein